MSQAVKRINLPSGGWWKILTRPLWEHVSQRSAACQGRGDNPDLVGPVLVSLTAAWSFPEDVSLEALAQRDVDDLVTVLEFFRREVVPVLEAHSPKEVAEEQLFAGLVAGRVPPQFAEVHLMAATGWSWRDLRATPADIVQKMAIYLAVKHAMDSGSALDLHAPEDGSDDQ